MCQAAECAWFLTKRAPYENTTVVAPHNFLCCKNRGSPTRLSMWLLLNRESTSALGVAVLRLTAYTCCKLRPQCTSRWQVLRACYGNTRNSLLREAWLLNTTLRSIEWYNLMGSCINHWFALDKPHIQTFWNPYTCTRCQMGFPRYYYGGA